MAEDVFVSFMTSMKDIVYINLLSLDIEITNKQTNLILYRLINCYIIN